MSNTSANYSGGIGFPGLLAIVFITLKLTGVIAWSWWWVLSPLWIPFVLIFGFLLLFLGVYLIARLFGAKPNFTKRF